MYWISFSFVINIFLKLGVPWSFLEFLGVPWSSLEFLGVPWSSLEFLGVPWSSFEFPRVPWSSWEFPGVLSSFSEELLGALGLERLEPCLLKFLKIVLQSLHRMILVIGRDCLDCTAVNPGTNQFFFRQMSFRQF